MSVTAVVVSIDASDLSLVTGWESGGRGPVLLRCDWSSPFIGLDSGMASEDWPGPIAPQLQTIQPTTLQQYLHHQSSSSPKQRRKLYEYV
ncbi:hypothetical protein HPB47_009212 [Ixodes persulcatus]|uniref:Uncharacterized protein n=1 Tax=Ixodes persulcatus TaxID=34615 RepID=A0AC60P2V4_IXOPE|nr:hypothetical protein HPB47_009212 [Ixodes persulcatus]